MEQVVQDLEPWEVPPGKEYWQALLNEGEYGEGATVSTEREDSNLGSEHDASVPKQTTEPARLEPDSQPTGQELVCWDTFARYQAEDKPIELQAVGFNRGGLLVEWDSVTGFVPASQLCGRVPYDDQLRRESLAGRVGSTLTLKVIELDPYQSRLILSERAARRVEERNPALLDELDAGIVCRGRVTNLCTFGAFVDLGGAEGLIHISELSWGRVSHPTDVLHGGQEIDVYVLNVDRDLGRVGLSLKRLKPDPWNTVESRYQIGQVVEGVVTNVVKFGAFVRIEEGVEGLIHASEFVVGTGTYHQSTRAGDVIQVRITSIEGVRHRIGLSLHQAQ